MIRLPLIWLLLAVCAPPASKYHAFQVFEGKGFVNLTDVTYRECSVEVTFASDKFTLGSQAYHIDYTEKFGDSNLSYFGHRMVKGERVQCSFIPLPPEQNKPWTLLFTWQDSLKAFHANVITP